MDTTEFQQGAAIPRPRIANACEACRSAKVKCQASNQLGICKRCLDSKRECIYKTGPRTRRPRQKKIDPSNNSNSNNNITDSNGTNNNITSPTTGPTPTYPPPPRPSKTFTIDIPMAADDDVTESFDALRIQHENSINDLVPFLSSDDDGEPSSSAEGMMDYDWLNSNSSNIEDGSSSVVSSHTSSLPVGASALCTPPSSSTVMVPQKQFQPGGRAKSRMVASLGLQPQFNLDSAGKLLSTFTKLMLNRFHCVDIREEDTVASLAKERPFVLLAVLAAASGSRTLQGHSLYDEEFRKILGLKYVAAGERSLELLQGLVVYIAWYPFHLRPKNKPALQYIRMAVDIVIDLELDQDPGTDMLDLCPTPSRLDEIRTYMACYYLASSFACTWGRTPSLLYNSYTAQCCDLLERHSTIKGDLILVWKVRLQRLIEETNDLRRTNRGHSQSEYQIELMIRGMETQLAEWEERMGSEFCAIPTIRLSVLFTRLFLSGAPLLKLPSVKLPTLDASSTFRADPVRLQSSIPTLHESYEYFISLPAEEINAFTGVEWGGFILSVILGFRMSFPLIVCPEWDDKTARDVLRFGEYMGRMCRMGEGKIGEEDINKLKTAVAAAGEKAVVSMDVLSASKVVLGVVRRKFLKRVAKLEGVVSVEKQQQQQQHHQQVQQVQQQQIFMPAGHPAVPAGVGSRGGKVQHDSAIAGCPMMDGSLDGYYHIWDETYSNGMNGNGAAVTNQGQIPSAAAAAAVNVSAIPATTGVDINGVPVSMQGEQHVAYNDLWAAMTMGWASQGGGPLTGFGGV